MSAQANEQTTDGRIAWHHTSLCPALFSPSLQGASKRKGIFAVLSGCAAKLLNGYESRHCQRGHPQIDWAERKGGVGERVHSAQRVNSANCIVPLCTELAGWQTDGQTVDRVGWVVWGVALTNLSF